MTTNEALMLSDDLLARFVLGVVDDAEQARVEDAMFASDELFERIAMEEDALCADYVRGVLDGATEVRLQERLRQVPHLRAKVTFHRTLAALATASAATTEPSRPRLRSWPRRRVLAAVTTMASAAALLFALRVADGPLAATERLALLPSETRGVASVPRAALRGQATLPLDLVLTTPERFSRYRVVLRRGGQVVWSTLVVPARSAAALAIDVPGEVLAPGLYAIELRAVEPRAEETVAWFELDLTP